MGHIPLTFGSLESVLYAPDEKHDSYRTETTVRVLDGSLPVTAYANVLTDKCKVKMTSQKGLIGQSIPLAFVCHGKKEPNS